MGVSGSAIEDLSFHVQMGRGRMIGYTDTASSAVACFSTFRCRPVGNATPSPALCIYIYNAWSQIGLQAEAQA